MKYRSRAVLFGLPLLHIATGTAADGKYQRGVAIGWVAVGDISIGVLLACGGVAFGGICVGGAALGLLPIGGLAFGLLAIGGLAFGLVAAGGAAFAWYAAVGGLAMATDYAIGGVASARHVVVPGAHNARPFSAIPHAQFAWPDAVLLLLIITALLFVALAIQARCKE
jgi:hypothetical protein